MQNYMGFFVFVCNVTYTNSKENIIRNGQTINDKTWKNPKFRIFALEHENISEA